MFLVQTRFFGAALESFFPKPVPYAKANLEQTGEALFASFSMQGLAPEQLALTKRNELFDYELGFQLFRGSAAFSINAQRVRIGFTNASFSQDLTTITDVAVRFYGTFEIPENTFHRVESDAHFLFESPQDFGEYFSTTGTKWQGEFAQAGLVAYIADTEWAEEIRVHIELSHVLPGGGYIKLSTIFFDPTITAEVLSRILGVFERAAKQCQLLFKPLA